MRYVRASCDFGECNMTTKANCYLCGCEVAKNYATRHLEKCIVPGESNCFLIKIEGACNKDYWLYIDIPLDMTMGDIDAFLRDIWLDCCGHLSEFDTVSVKNCHRITMRTKISKFSEGDVVLYDYDFGSTTELVLTFVKKIKRTKANKGIRLLLRNQAPQIMCSACGVNPADNVLEFREYPFLCCQCNKKYKKNNDGCKPFPITNSPRCGVCVYDGSLDIYKFDPSKITGNVPSVRTTGGETTSYASKKHKKVLEPDTIDMPPASFVRQLKHFSEDEEDSGLDHGFEEMDEENGDDLLDNGCTEVFGDAYQDLLKRFSKVLGKNHPLFDMMTHDDDIDHDDDAYDDDAYDDDELGFNGDGMIDEFGKFKTQFFAHMVLIMLGYYGVLTRTQIIALWHKYFSYSDYEGEDLDHQFKYIEGWYMDDLGVYVHPSIWGSPTLDKIVGRMIMLHNEQDLFDIDPKEIFLMSQDAPWIPDYYHKAIEITQNHQVKMESFDITDENMLWYTIQILSLRGMDIKTMIKKHLSPKRSVAFKLAFTDLVKHTRLWVLNGRMPCEPE